MIFRAAKKAELVFLSSAMSFHINWGVEGELALGPSTNTELQQDQFQLINTEPPFFSADLSSWSNHILGEVPPVTAPFPPPAEAITTTKELPGASERPPPSGTHTQWMAFTGSDYEKRKQRERKKATHRVLGAHTTTRVEFMDTDTKQQLQRWFKQRSIHNLFATGSPLVLPSEIQWKWEQLKAGQLENLSLPSDIHTAVSNFLWIFDSLHSQLISSTIS
jgi:hypothetical protein